MRPVVPLLRGLKVPLTIRNAFGDPGSCRELERLLHAIFDAEERSVVAVVTPAVDRWHAEVLILREGQRCAACFADLTLPAADLSARVRAALNTGSTPPGAAKDGPGRLI